MRLRMFSAPAQTAGFPPKVEPCVPGVMVSFTFSPMRHAPIGRPPPRPFAVVIISGTIPNCCQA